jgi:hypothetical protein
MAGSRALKKPMIEIPKGHNVIGWNGKCVQNALNTRSYSSPTATNPPNPTGAPILMNTAPALASRADSAAPVRPSSNGDSVLSPTLALAPAADCDPAYPDVCIPPRPPDRGCDDIAFEPLKSLNGTDVTEVWSVAS